MPEIPVIPQRVQAPQVTQLADTQTSRMMGDATSQMGQAMVQYGASLMQATKKNVDKTKTYAAKTAVEELKERLRIKRSEEGFFSPKDDPTGVRSLKNLSAYSKEIAPRIIEEYGFGDDKDLVAMFQYEAAKVTNDESFAFSADMAKVSGEMAVTAHQQLMNVRGQRVREDLRELPLVFAEIDMEISEDNDLSPEQKINSSMDFKRQVTESAIRSYKYKNGTDGMSDIDYAMARGVLDSEPVMAIFTAEERENMHAELFATYSRDVGFRASVQNQDYAIMTRERDEAERKGVQEVMLARMNAGSNFRDIRAANDMALAMLKEGTITPEAYNRVTSYDNLTLEESGHHIGSDMIRMFVDDSVYRNRMQQAGMDTKGDKFNNIANWLQKQFTSNKMHLTNAKREELLSVLHRYKDKTDSERKSIRQKYNEIAFNARLNQAAAAGATPKDQEYLKAQFIQIALGNLNDVEGSFNMDKIDREMGTRFGTGSSTPGDEGKTEKQLAEEIRTVRSQLNAETNPHKRKALAQRLHELNQNLIIVRETIGGKNVHDVVPRRSRKRTVTD